MLFSLTLFFFFFICCLGYFQVVTFHLLFCFGILRWQTVRVVRACVERVSFMEKFDINFTFGFTKTHKLFNRMHRTSHWTPCAPVLYKKKKIARANTHTKGTEQYSAKKKKKELLRITHLRFLIMMYLSACSHRPVDNVTTMTYTYIAIQWKSLSLPIRNFSEKSNLTFFRDFYFTIVFLTALVVQTQREYLFIFSTDSYLV